MGIPLNLVVVLEQEGLDESRELHVQIEDIDGERHDKKADGDGSRRKGARLQT